MTQRSTVMCQDGSQRLCHLIRDGEGFWTFQAEGIPSTQAVAPDPPLVGTFEVDVTQAIYQAIRCEMVERSPLYRKAMNAAEDEILERHRERIKVELKLKRRAYLQQQRGGG